MPKTKDEIVATALMDWNTKHKSDENWFKSRVQGAWHSGYCFGMEQSKEVIEAVKKEYYDKGHSDGYHAGDMLNIEGSIRDSFQNGYKAGLIDAWEAAGKIYDEYSIDEMEALFRCDVSDIRKVDPSTAIDKLKWYENEPESPKEFHLGEEVEAWDTNGWVKFIAIGDDGGGSIAGFDTEGGSFLYPFDSCRKTGKHYDIKGFVENHIEEKKESKTTTVFNGVPIMDDEMQRKEK